MSGSFSLFTPKLKYVAESPSLSILSQTRALPTHSVNYSIISISSMAPIIMQLFFCTFIVGMPQTINSKGAGTVSGLLSYEVE